MIQKLIEASIRNRVLVVILFVLVALLSIFSLKTARIDAIPDIGENQQIVFTEWPGRSPKDIEEQVTYPLSIMLQGIPGVKNIRGISAFGFSTIYVIFKDDVDFYWSRSRVLEKLSTAGSELPSGVVPQMGPDATGLGQIYWYTIENEENNIIHKVNKWMKNWFPIGNRPFPNWGILRIAMRNILSRYSYPSLSSS